MFEICKAASTVPHTPDESALAAINRLTQRELTADEVYTFSVRACDDLPDRDYERFTAECLHGLAELYIGKTMIFDHNWSASQQVARVYATEVAQEDNAHYLRVECYMLRNEAAKPIIDAIEGGILREVSVGCACGSVTCSICGSPYSLCRHSKGCEYDGAVCIAELSEPTDAYELSFVAVPAQPRAGIVKHGKHPMSTNDLDAAKARLQIEKIRFGGTS